MFPRLFLWLMIGGGIASLAMGFMHELHWLYYPPLAFGAYFFGSSILVDIRRNTMGYGRAELVFPSMIGTNIAVTLWNTFIQTALFFAGWAVSSVFSLVQ